jgi:hypothetical protein
MKIVKYEDMTKDQLVSVFAEIAVAQYEALFDRRINAFNRLFDKMQAIARELQSRDGDQRKELLKLYQHKNVQVRLKAAVHTLAVAPDAARAMLHQIEESREFPQAGDAGMTLWNLEQGIFKPT